MRLDPSVVRQNTASSPKLNKHFDHEVKQEPPSSQTESFRNPKKYKNIPSLSTSSNQIFLLRSCRILTASFIWIQSQAKPAVAFFVNSRNENFQLWIMSVLLLQTHSLPLCVQHWYYPHQAVRTNRVDGWYILRPTRPPAPKPHGLVRRNVFLEKRKWGVSVSEFRAVGELVAN